MTPAEKQQILDRFRQQQKDYRARVVLPAAAGFTIFGAAVLYALLGPTGPALFGSAFLGLPVWAYLLMGLGLIIFSFATVIQLSRCPNCGKELTADFFAPPRGTARTWYHCPHCDVELRQPEARKRK